MAKIANVFGRLEAFTFSVFVYGIGYIQMAGSRNVQTFASAQIFYSAGATGLQILQQIFIADTSDLLNRAFFSSIPDIPFLITVWVGAPIAKSLLAHASWRWGYGLWAIVLPVAFLPLALALFVNTRKAAKLRMVPQSPWEGQSFVGGLRSLWYELDIFGLLLLSAAISLILIPCTLAATAGNGWHNNSIIAMIIIGCVCLIVFPFWESSKTLAPRPFLALRHLTNRTVLVGCAIGFFYFGELLWRMRRIPYCICWAYAHTSLSCLLHFDPALFLFISSSGSERFYYGCWTYHANLHLHFYRGLGLDWYSYQLYAPL